MPRPRMAGLASRSTSRPMPDTVTAATSRCRCSASSRSSPSAPERSRLRPAATPTRRLRRSPLRRRRGAGTAGDSLKIRVPSAPSGLPKLLPALPSGWTLESAGDYAPGDTEGSALPNTGTTRVLLYRSDAGTIRVEIRVDPTVVDGFGVDPNGDPNSKSVVVHGQPAVLTIDPTANGVDMLGWGEGEHTLVTIMATGVDEEALLAFAESLQPSAEGWSAFPCPRASPSCSTVIPMQRWATAGPRGSSATAAPKISASRRILRSRCRRRRARQMPSRCTPVRRTARSRSRSAGTPV